MKRLLALEEAAQLALTLALLYYYSPPFHWGWGVLLFFAPDVGGLGYLHNSATGAVAYNFLHHKLVAITIAVAGFGFTIPWLTAVGILFYAHSSFDRAIGYGLKYLDSGSHTHLGYIGKERFKNNL